jgi:3-oxoacyl-[acyl-carrier protein] reductase
MTRIVLVTGTSKGIGKALAQAFLERGDRVHGCSRSAAAIAHPGYGHTELDLADDTAVRQMFRTLAGGPERLEAVIHNAGLTQNRLALMTGAAEAEQLIRANLLAAFLVNREAVKLMKRTRYGRIVNMSSINVRLASAGSTLYNATKAAVETLGASLSRECGGDDITINCLAPSLVAESGMAASLSAEGAAAKQAALPKPQLLETAELVHAIDFLTHPLARNITGQTIYFGGVS